ncbi:MAG: tail fiber domain-containing protein [Chitinophagaceae bacterium]
MKNFYKLFMALLFSVQLNAQSSFNYSLLPAISDSFNIGTSNKKWNDGYFSGKLYIGSYAQDISLEVSSDAMIAGILIGHGKGNDPTNTVLGTGSLSANTYGRNNTALGYFTLNANSGGNDNTAVGTYALYKNDGGVYNTALGSLALTSNTSGIVNTAIGSYSLFKNMSGFYNTALGNFALLNNTKGSQNTVIGNYGMYYNITGRNNTSTGFEALFRNTTGHYNTANGYYTLYSNDSGRDNTAMGVRALFLNISGNGNTAVGKFSLQSNKKGSRNTALGIGSDVTLVNLFNAMALGNQAKINASNKVQVGNEAVTVIGGPVGWSVVSDGRFKSNVQENVPGLLFIKKLRPVTYNLDVEKFEKYIGANDSLEESNEIKDDYASQKIRTGFIAQEVEKTVTEIKYDFDGLNKPTNEKDNYSLVYADFVPSLVKSVQELSLENDSLKQSIQSLQAQFDQLKSMLTSGTYKDGMSENFPSSNASLEQNIPNPYNQNTVIQYTLPSNYKSAQMRITDNYGKEIKSIPLSGFGKSQINFKAYNLASGTYHYALIVDGKIIAAKIMVLIN